MFARVLLTLLAFLLSAVALYLSRDGLDTLALASAILAGLCFLGAGLLAPRDR